jgi:serine/threonine protein phosphatase PrpC
VRGKSHVLNGAPNQDALGSTAEPRGACVVVADGHGNKLHFRSASGARFAVEETILQFQKLGPERPSEADILNLGRVIAENWKTHVLAHLSEQAFAEEEVAGLDAEARTSLARQPEVAYGSTLLAVAATAEWVAYLQLGDGDILAVDESGVARRPLPPDPYVSGNRTTSLCQEDAWKQMRVTVETGRPALIALSTDGYANCFATDGDFLQIGSDYLQMVRQKPEHLANSLPDILTEATQQGSSDDITLALLYWGKSESRGRSSAWLKRALLAVAFTLLLAAVLVALPLFRSPPGPPPPRPPAARIP